MRPQGPSEQIAQETEVGRCFVVRGANCARTQFPDAVRGLENIAGARGPVKPTFVRVNGGDERAE